VFARSVISFDRSGCVVSLKFRINDSEILLARPESAGSFATGFEMNSVVG